MDIDIQIYRYRYRYIDTDIDIDIGIGIDRYRIGFVAWLNIVSMTPSKVSVIDLCPILTALGLGKCLAQAPSVRESVGVSVDYTQGNMRCMKQSVAMIRTE